MNTKEKILAEWGKLLQTNEVYRDVLGKWGAEITRNFINQYTKELIKKLKGKLKRKDDFAITGKRSQEDIVIAATYYNQAIEDCIKVIKDE